MECATSFKVTFVSCSEADGAEAREQALNAARLIAAAEMTAAASDLCVFFIDVLPNGNDLDSYSVWMNEKNVHGLLKIFLFFFFME